jgi:type I restriction enzyme S subunit
VIDLGLPMCWTSTKFEELVLNSFTGLVRSASEQSAENEYAYLKMNNLSSSGKFELTNLVKVSATDSEVKKYTLQSGDFIFNTRNSVELVGKCGVFDAISTRPILFNNNLLKITFVHTDPKIIAHWLNSAFGKEQLKSITSATTSVAAIYQKQLMALNIPVIPLAEQKVIAEKLDELLAQVDILKTRLTTIPKLLKRFRQSVLAAAVSGKLTAEWRGENTCFLDEGLDLLVQSERKEKGIKVSKKVVSTEFDSVPFDIPESWAWKALGDIALKITDGAHNTPKVVNEGFPYLMAKDLTGGMLDFSENRFISEAEHTELHSKCKPEKGDLLIVNIGAGTGNNVLVDVDFEFSFKNIAIIKRPSFIDPKFLKYFYEAEKQRIFNEQTRGGAQPFLSLTVLNTLLFALPPKTEQTEIVRRVEQLFAFADQIEQQVKNAQSRVNNLTQSILAKAFRGELTADWRAANPDLITGENSAQALLAKIKAERDKPKKMTKQQAMFSE